MSTQRKARRHVSISLIISTALAILLSGCTTWTVEPQGTLQNPPRVAALPAKVGVYYSDELRTYEHRFSRGMILFVIPLGKATVRFLDETFPIVFEKATVVAGLPPRAETENYAFVIQPRIEDFNFIYPWTPFGTFSAEITYRFTLYSKDGTPFASWTVNGLGNISSAYEATGSPIGYTSSLALEDAAKKFLSGFYEEPEVRAWMRQVGITEAK